MQKIENLREKDIVYFFDTEFLIVSINIPTPELKGFVVATRVQDETLVYLDTEIYSKLSFTPYNGETGGATWQRPLNWNDCIGQYGLFWDSTETNLYIIGKLTSYDSRAESYKFKRGTSHKFKRGTGQRYRYFKPLNPEQLEALKSEIESLEK